MASGAADDRALRDLPKVKRRKTAAEVQAEIDEEQRREEEADYLEAELTVLRAIRERGVYWPGEG